MRFRYIDARRDLREWSGPPLRASENLIHQIVAAVSEAQLVVGESIARIAVGSSGVEAPGELASELARAIEPQPGRIVVAHDSISAHAGALAGAPGAVLAVGTGTVCLATGNGAPARVDGWGHLLGDGGSGYWIGRIALEAALKDLDGRRGSPEIRSAAEERFSQLPQFVRELPSRNDRVALVASFAANVISLATQGDKAARAILELGATVLAQTAATALRRAGWTQSTTAPVTYTGAILTASTLYRELLSEALANEWPSAQIVSPMGTPLDGVGRLLDLDRSHPLRHLVAQIDSHTD